MAIESRLVSKTIENAQSRVEGYNFDIRKRVVEYDDVINKQRETIYAERDKVLRNEDLTETVRDFIRAELDVLTELHLGPVVDEWDIEGLARAVLAMGIEGPDIDAEGLAAQGSREGIVEALYDAVDAQLEEREKEHGPDVWAMVERLVLLRTIDALWVDHLTELDDFRRGVGLRGYGGTDPLNEFKREAFQLYEELRGFIRHQVASTIFRVSVQRQEPPPPQQMRMPSAGRAGPDPGRIGVDQRRRQQRRSPTGPRLPVAAGAQAASGTGRGRCARRSCLRDGHCGAGRGGPPAGAGKPPARPGEASSTATRPWRELLRLPTPPRWVATSPAGAARARSSRSVTGPDAGRPTGDGPSRPHGRRDAETGPPEARSRALAWEGLLNARDLGGLPTADGGRIRWGALVRSDLLPRLTRGRAGGTAGPRRRHAGRRALSRGGGP